MPSQAAIHTAILLASGKRKVALVVTHQIMALLVKVVVIRLKPLPVDASDILKHVGTGPVVSQVALSHAFITAVARIVIKVVTVAYEIRA